MDNFNDLKATWQSANTSGLPDAKAIATLVKTYRNKKLRSKIRIVIMSSIVALFFGVLMYINRGAMASTLIGEGLFVLSLLILGYTNLRSIKRFYVLNDCSNREFISFLEQTRRNQVYYYRRTQVVAMSFYSLALLFFVYEPVHHRLWLLLLTYTLLIAALLRFWIVVRPKAYQQQSQKLQMMIDQAKRLAQQLH